MSNPVTKISLSIYKGSTYRHKIDVVENAVAKDLTGYTARMEIRDAAGALLHTCTTANAELSVDPTGAVTIHIDGVDIYAWAFTEALYDLFVIDPTGEPYAVSWGAVIVYPSYTDVT